MERPTHAVYPRAKPNLGDIASLLFLLVFSLGKRRGHRTSANGHFK